MDTCWCLRLIWQVFKPKPLNQCSQCYYHVTEEERANLDKGVFWHVVSYSTMHYGFLEVHHMLVLFPAVFDDDWGHLIGPYQCSLGALHFYGMNIVDVRTNIIYKPWQFLAPGPIATNLSHATYKKCRNSSLICGIHQKDMQYVRFVYTITVAMWKLHVHGYQPAPLILQVPECGQSQLTL